MMSFACSVKCEFREMSVWYGSQWRVVGRNEITTKKKEEKKL